MTYISSNDNVIREIINGQWFFVSLEIIAILSIYCWSTFRKSHSFIAWIKRLDIQVILAWIIYMIGSNTRAGWVWLLLECQNRTMTRCLHITTSAEILFAAAIAAVIGGCLLVMTITSKQMRPLWLGIGFIAMILPVLVHYF